MRFVFIILFVSSFAVSCQTMNRRQAASPATLPATDPMSCRIEGSVVRILGITGNDTSGPCHLHPCHALVSISRMAGCGSSVSLPLAQGDTIEINFAYTLDDTRRIFPSMAVHYPGLRNGQSFTAIARQRLAPGSPGYWIVYDYNAR